MALAYMVVVLLASARAGRVVGIILAIVCFLAFNFFLLPPYYTFVIAEPLDWLVLLAFLIVSTVGAQLLHRVQREAENARKRAAELDRLSRLGAETLSVGRAEDAVEAVARVLLAELAIAACEVYQRTASQFVRIAVVIRDGMSQQEANAELLTYALERDAIVVERVDGTTHLIPDGARLVDGVPFTMGAHAVLVPLRARDHVVGVLRLIGGPTIVLDAAQARFAGALADYAALGLERVRLAGEAERAAALQEADRLKDAFLANVSHDLRTPLTTIKALAHEIRSDGDDRVAIVADLLDLSRIYAGGMSVTPEINAADDLIGAALERVSGIAGAAAIQPRIMEEDGLLLGRFDFVHALRALVNLLENALKYSADTPVELEVLRTGDRLIIDVLDRGPGIPPEDTERIFEPFQRGQTASAAGTGLGLAIARRVAEAQGGSLRYHPRAGGGSIFRLELPAADVTDLGQM
jgi:two-component system sensor histidine kinase KdpD